MRKAAICAVGLGAMLLGSSPVLAHHSGAMFDSSKQVSVTGVIKEFEYTNPHSWVRVMAPDSTGKIVEWGFESEGPSTLMRNGIKRSALKEGEKVTVVCNPMRDGRPTGALMRVTKIDTGEVIYFRGRPPAAAPAAPAAPAG